MKILLKSLVLFSFTFAVLAWIFLGHSGNPSLESKSHVAAGSIPESAPAAKLKEASPMPHPGKSAAVAAKTRMVAANPMSFEQAKQAIQSKSKVPWTFHVENQVASLSLQMLGGQLNLESTDAEQGAKNFLNQYAESLLGVDPAQFSDAKVVRDADATQVIYEQSLNGIKVVGSRLNMMFDLKADMNFLSSDLSNPKSVRSPAESKITLSQAASMARVGLLNELNKNNLVDSSFELPVASIESVGELIYNLRLGNASLNYRFDLVLPAPVSVEYEIQVDAIEAAVVSIVRKSKNL